MYEVIFGNDSSAYRASLWMSHIRRWYEVGKIDNTYMVPISCNLLPDIALSAYRVEDELKIEIRYHNSTTQKVIHTFNVSVSGINELIFEFFPMDSGLTEDGDYCLVFSISTDDPLMNHEVAIKLSLDGDVKEFHENEWDYDETRDIWIYSEDKKDLVLYTPMLPRRPAQSGDSEYEYPPLRNRFGPY